MHSCRVIHVPALRAGDKGVARGGSCYAASLRQGTAIHPCSQGPTCPPSRPDHWGGGSFDHQSGNLTNFAECWGGVRKGSGGSCSSTAPGAMTPLYVSPVPAGRSVSCVPLRKKDPVRVVVNVSMVPPARVQSCAWVTWSRKEALVPRASEPRRTSSSHTRVAATT